MTDDAKLIALTRCMGGKFCNHQPGTCTATNAEYQAKAKARTDHPNATDMLNKAEREAAYWRERCEALHGRLASVVFEAQCHGYRETTPLGTAIEKAIILLDMTTPESTQA